IGCSYTDPKTHVSFLEALSYARKLNIGIGFVLVPELNLVAIDLDDCIEDGKPNPWVERILAEAGSYAEITPSGKGVRIWLKGSIPRNIRNDDLKVEIYKEKRFLTVTGWWIESTPREIRENQKFLDRFYSELIGEKKEIRKEFIEKEAEKSGESSEISCIDILKALKPEALAKLEKGAGDNCLQGEHPVHGSEHTGRNFAISEDGSSWYCFRHNVGGRWLSLAGMLLGIVTCEELARRLRDRKPEENVQHLKDGDVEHLKDVEHFENGARKSQDFTDRERQLGGKKLEEKGSLLKPTEIKAVLEKIKSTNPDLAKCITCSRCSTSQDETHKPHRDLEHLEHVEHFENRARKSHNFSEMLNRDVEHVIHFENRACIRKSVELEPTTSLRLWILHAKQAGKDLNSASLEFPKIKEIPSNAVLEILSWAETTNFSACDFAQALGLCDPNCPFNIDPAMRILNDTWSVVELSSVGKLRLNIKGREIEVNKSDLFIYDRENGIYIIDMDFFASLYIDLYDFPPKKLTPAHCYKIYEEWIKRAERIREPLTPESDILRGVIEAIVDLPLYSFEDARTGQISVYFSAFVDGNQLIINNNLLRRVLDQAGINYSFRKLRVALKDILLGVDSRRVADPSGNSQVYRFWVFNINAIKKLAKILLNFDWEPVIQKKEIAEQDSVESKSEEEKQIIELDWDRINVG
ncbi:MAG: hypothetical protein QW540_07670, partial [Archaeoglobaceae archaeon]